MRPLQARHGVFFVTGNHEYFSGVEAWLEVLQGMGWTVLENEHRILRHGAAQLTVAGMPDPTSPSVKPSLREALRGAPPSPILLLYHPPTGARRAAQAGVALQLSGHTHGGQYFPWTLAVSALFDHPCGLGREGAMWIHTSPGAGFWGPPNRLFRPKEITLIRLKGHGAAKD